MNILILLCVILLADFEAGAISYDYSANIDCLAQPEKPQYNGGIIQNPELNNGLQGWTTFGNAKIEHRESFGNKYVVAHTRNQPHDSVSQKIYLQKGLHYSLSAWIQVSEANVPIKAVLKTSKGYKFGGAIFAENNCWTMLKGGLIADTTGPAYLYFESNNTSAEIWIDSVSLQPFTKKQWRSHQKQSIQKARKTKVVVQALDEEGQPLGNASISVRLKKPSFPFGSAINKYILNNTAYQSWFTSRFTVTTFENEMKWYTNEYAQGKDNYFEADEMLLFAQKHNISVRGHNIFWDDPQFQPSWVPSLARNQLKNATENRVNSIVSRYKGQLIGWDVINENMHNSFFETRLGNKFTAKMFNMVHNIDSETTLFMNDYNTIEDNRDGISTPAMYIQKLREIQSSNKQMPLGIGLESHFPNIPPNLPYMRASLDTLAATGLPTWMTELDVNGPNNQAEYLEQVLREAHSHPAIQGIVMWTARSPEGCFRLCLVDNNFKNLPTGDVVDKLIKEWGRKNVSGTTDQMGSLRLPFFMVTMNLKFVTLSRINILLLVRYKCFQKTRPWKQRSLCNFLFSYLLRRGKVVAYKLRSKE